MWRDETSYLNIWGLYKLKLPHKRNCLVWTKFLIDDTWWTIVIWAATPHVVACGKKLFGTRVVECSMCIVDSWKRHFANHGPFMFLLVLFRRSFKKFTSIWVHRKPHEWCTLYSLFLCLSSTQTLLILVIQFLWDNIWATTFRTKKSQSTHMMK